MSASERTYRLFLRAYPADFRATFGREMMLVFRAQRRAPDGRGPGFWAGLVWDVVRSAPALRWEAARARWELIHTGEGAMRTMGMFTVLVGVLEAVGALAEGWAGGVRGGSPRSVFAGVLGPLAGAALATAGLALARRSPRAAATATGGAVVCLVAFSLMLLAGGRLSIAANALGICFPLVLLASRRFGHHEGPSIGAAALLLLALALPGRLTAQAPAAKDLPLSPAERQVFVGTYHVTLPGGMETDFRVFEENGALEGTPGNQDETRRLVYQGDNVFLVEGVPDFSLTFTVEHGRATKFILRKEDGSGEGIRVP